MSRVTALRARLLVAVAAATLVLASNPGAGWGQPAVVEGTTQLFIRRGPGTDFPPFATLTGGSQVQVEELREEWARVTTASGQVGYVSAKFLRMVENQPAPAVVSPAAPEPTAAAPTKGEPTTAATPTKGAPTARPTRTPARRQEATPHVQSSPTEDAPDPTATPSEIPTSTAEKPQAWPRGSNEDRGDEITRLADAIEALNRRFDQRLPIPDEGASTPPRDSASAVSGGAILLGLVGVIIGWFLGATYQRNKERGRRSRIRL